MSFKTWLVLALVGLGAPTVDAKRRCKTKSTSPVFGSDTSTSLASSTSGLSTTSPVSSILVSTTTPGTTLASTSSSTPPGSVSSTTPGTEIPSTASTPAVSESSATTTPISTASTTPTTSSTSTTATPNPPICDLQGISTTQSYFSTNEYSDYNSCRERCQQDSQCKAFLPYYQRRCWLYTEKVADFVSPGSETVYFSDRDCPAKAPDPPQCDVQGLSSIPFYTSTDLFSDYNSCRDWCRQDPQCKAFLPNYQRKCYLYTQNVAQFVSVGGNTAQVVYFSDRDCAAKAPDPPKCDIQGISSIPFYASTDLFSDYNSCRDWCRQDPQCKAFLPNYQRKCYLYDRPVSQFVSVGDELVYFSDKDCPAKAPDPPRCDIQGISSIPFYLSTTEFSDYNSCRDWCRQDPQCKAFLPNYQRKCYLYDRPVSQFVSAGGELVYFSDKDCPAKAPDPPSCNVQGLSSTQSYYSTTEFSDYNSCRERCQQDSQCKAFLPNYQHKCWLYSQVVTQFVSADGNTGAYFSDKDCPVRPPSCDVEGFSAIQAYYSTSVGYDYNSCRERCIQDQQCKAFLPNLDSQCRLYTEKVEQFVSPISSPALFSDRECPAKAVP